MTERSVIQTGNNVVKYPNPFFDLAKNYLPKSIKSLFSHCRTFFYTNDFIHNVVTKLTEYPITDILFEDVPDRKVEKVYQDYFNQKIHLKELLISIGLDYYTYGNCFVIAQLQTKRVLLDEQTDTTYTFDDVVNIKLQKDGKIRCDINRKGSEKKNAVLSIEDTEIKNTDGLIFNKLSPTNIDIEYDEYTGQCEYYYAIPDKVKKQVRNNNKHILATIPRVLLDAIMKKKKVRLEKNNLFHFKAPTLSEEDAGWGKPPILPAMKKLYYMATLMRGNEAIAVEHIVPKKVIFPSPSGAFDLHNVNMGKWTGSAKSSIEKWKTDPNHIAIMPIPMGYQELGGTGRSLLLTPELKFLEETIINGLGVPIEFVKGGASWTGSSVSLRIIENHFLNYRERLEDFINHFVVKKMNSFIGVSRVTVKLARMRMNDDSEAKQMAMNLNASQKISDETLLKELQYDPNKEKIRIQEEAGFRRDLAIDDTIANAEAQGRAQLIVAKYQVQAQEMARDEAARQDERMFAQELEEELGVEEEGIHEQVKKLAFTIAMLPDEKLQMKALKELYNQSPVTYNLVVQRMSQMSAEASVAQVEIQKAEIENEKDRLDMADKAVAIQERNQESRVRTRNEDKSGPKRDAVSGKAKV